MKLCIFISGRGSNMKAIHQHCENGVLKSIAQCELVFSNNENAAGLEYAKSQNINTACISSKGKKREEYDTEVIQLLENYEFNFIILAGYMRILSEKFIDKYPRKIINIHPADTNKHQGLNAYRWAFENNLKETTITIHYVDKGVDTGKVIAKKAIDISSAKTVEELEKIGLKAEHQFYSNTLKELLKTK